MSRVGNIKIVKPNGVDVKYNKENDIIEVKGPKGALSHCFNGILFNVDNDFISIHIDSNKVGQCESNKLHGLYRVLLNNMIIGVSSGFEKKLELIGVGYKANMITDNVLELDLGYSHKVLFCIPKELTCKVEAQKGKNIIVILSGTDKFLVGQIASKIKELRPV
jgi:large subunit ribosomal protein L6